MEQRQDYLEAQIDQISRMLKKILEKILKLKSDEISDGQIKHILNTEISGNGQPLTIEQIEGIENNLLVKTLSVEFGYSPIPLRHLADLLFELSQKMESKTFLARKALIIYQYVLLDKKNNLNFSILNRIKDLENLK